MFIWNAPGCQRTSRGNGYLDWICSDDSDYANIGVLMEKLILFDIDGTLTRTQNGYVPFNEALQKAFGLDGDIRTVIPDGNTDPLIVEDILSKANLRFAIDGAGWTHFAETLGVCYREAIRQGATTVRPLPGAVTLLQTLAGSGRFHPSVVTGNFELTANIKLEAAELLPHLQRGAYASDSHRRADLPYIAKTRWEETNGRKLLPEQCVVIGDTPKDLAAARHNRMKCVLVGTGRYPIEELRYAGPDECLADLLDTKSMVELLAKI
ncbi:MAG TPA: HAD family hydrolase [Candidatus Binatia bacterium]|nr:HAD family hydrolase [Candidatus Binatia bacterium]